MQTQEIPDLRTVRKSLREVDEKVVHAFSYRTGFKMNDAIYVPDDDGLSIVDHLLLEIENAYQRAWGYNNPECVPFSAEFQKNTVRRRKNALGRVSINMNQKIRAVYLDYVRMMCEKGDDGDYQEAALGDVDILLETSRRIHMGMFVAASKLLGDPDGYRKLIIAGDSERIKRRLTDTTVEGNVLRRVSDKGRQCHLKPRQVRHLVRFYRNHIIPLTKEVEIEYMMQTQSADFQHL